MAIISIRKILSGNHGRDNTNPAPGGVPQLSTGPVQSNRPFIAPNASVRRTPSISDITKEIFSEPKTEETPKQVENVPQTPPVPAPLTPAPEPEPAPAVAPAFPVEEPAPAQPQTETQPAPQQPEPEETPAVVAESTPLSEPKSFEEEWHKMFDKVFKDIPTLYYPYKEYTPELKENMIHMTVTNEIQKDGFEAKKRDILENLRNNFSNEIEDLLIVTNENFVAKKIIYDNKDKLENFAEENPNFTEFVSILNLNMN